MSGRNRFGILVLSLLLLPVSLSGQISPNWNQCRGDTLSTWNCGRYYSGTVTFTSQLKTPNGPLNSSTVITVTAGQASCRIEDAEGGKFSGPGLIAVQHESTLDSGEYGIIVWCPDTEGERVGRHDSPFLDMHELKAANYAVLEGKDSYESANADDANGITGTDTITWSLKKN